MGHVARFISCRNNDIIGTRLSRGALDLLGLRVVAQALRQARDFNLRVWIIGSDRNLSDWLILRDADAVHRSDGRRRCIVNRNDEGLGGCIARSIGNRDGYYGRAGFLRGAGDFLGRGIVGHALGQAGDGPGEILRCGGVVGRV